MSFARVRLIYEVLDHELRDVKHRANVTVVYGGAERQNEGGKGDV